MIEMLVNHPLIDDFQTLSVTQYIKAREKNFPHLKEDFSFLNAYKTMLVLSISYPKETVKFKGKGYGLVSRYSYGKDYHLVYQSLFETLIKAFEKQKIKAIGYADTGPIDERYAAYLSGLGYLGKNQFLIHPQHGTYHYLGILLVDKLFHKESYPYDSCGSCNRCVEACPTNALDGGFHKERCTSYTTQAKVELTHDDIKPIKTMIFGCDICQKVCPKNTGIQAKHHPEFAPDSASQLNLIELLKMSNKAIQNRYRHYAFSFRGGLILKRNAIILLANQHVHSSYDLCKQVYQQYHHVPWFEKTIRKVLKDWEAIQ